MTLQERIDFIILKDFPASVKRKHLSHLMLHLGDYSEDADELGQAYDRICEALEQLDNEITSLNQAHEFKSRKYDKGADGSLTKDLLNSLYGKFNTPQPLTVTELDHTLQAALARLPAEDRRFCAALAHRPVSALAAEGFGSRSALYRRLADLRHVLTAHGLGPAWDDLAAA